VPAERHSAPATQPQHPQHPQQRSLHHIHVRRPSDELMAPLVATQWDGGLDALSPSSSSISPGSGSRTPGRPPKPHNALPARRPLHSRREELSAARLPSWVATAHSAAAAEYDALYDRLPPPPLRAERSEVLGPESQSQLRYPRDRRHSDPTLQPVRRREAELEAEEEQAALVMAPLETHSLQQPQTLPTQRARSPVPSPPPPRSPRTGHVRRHTMDQLDAVTAAEAAALPAGAPVAFTRSRLSPNSASSPVITTREELSPLTVTVATVPPPSTPSPSPSPSSAEMRREEAASAAHSRGDGLESPLRMDEATTTAERVDAPMGSVVERTTSAAPVTGADSGVWYPPSQPQERHQRQQDASSVDEDHDCRRYSSPEAAMHRATEALRAPRAPQSPRRVEAGARAEAIEAAVAVAEVRVLGSTGPLGLAALAPVVWSVDRVEGSAVESQSQSPRMSVSERDSARELRTREQSMERRQRSETTATTAAWEDAMQTAEVRPDSAETETLPWCRSTQSFQAASADPALSLNLGKLSSNPARGNRALPSPRQLVEAAAARTPGRDGGASTLTAAAREAIVSATSRHKDPRRRYNSTPRGPAIVQLAAVAQPPVAPWNERRCAPHRSP
jgi:hypothetical protein